MTILGHYVVIHKEIMHIGKARHLNICEDLRKMKDITKGGIVFPSSKTSYMEANTQKYKEIGIMGPGTAHMRLAHSFVFLGT